MSARYSAAMCYLLIALCLIGAWYGFLFASNTTGVLPGDYLRWALFTEHPDHELFVWLAVSPILSLGLGLYYMLARHIGTTGALVLFVLGAVHCAGAAWYFPPKYAAFCLAPIYFAFYTWDEASKLSKDEGIT